jgi:hypothetical protein
MKGFVMKNSFVAMSVALLACMGCTAVDSSQLLPPHEYHAPPAGMQQHPGPMVDGPGPGVLPPIVPSFPASFVAKTTQVRFVGPAGTTIGWMIRSGYADNQLITPGRYEFPQGATYRLKFSNIPGPGREGLMLYPTLQVYPAHPTTDAYLAHNSVPLEITDEDLDQVASNNFVTKVIYLPDEKFQEFAIAGVETLVSTRLDPGVDPIAEADRRGTIMVVLRIGNVDLEMHGPHGPAAAGIDGASGIQQASYQVDGNSGQFVPPMPISAMEGGLIGGVPGPMIVGNSGMPGMPAYNPVSGVGGIPAWGQPITGTPIGLPGPPHLPLGGPAGLQSHTMRNLTKVDVGRPVDHMLIDVQHKPGISLPKPVEYVRYDESHPVHGPNDVAYPSWALPQGQLPTPPPSGEPHLFHY